MRAMAYKLFSSLKCHPLITAISVLLLFTLPLFHLLMFFWPLIVSTVLGVLAVISFGRQSYHERATPSAACGTAETAWQPDIISFPSHEEKISNMLMVGNQEVTWLEWLHNEDTRKLCSHEYEHAVWDAYGRDISSTASEAHASRASFDVSNDSICKDETIDDASLQAEDKGRLYACDSRGEDERPVSALVLAEDKETRAAVLPSTALDGSRGTVIVHENVNKEKMNTPIVTDEDKTHLDLTEEDQMCRFGTTTPNGILFTVDGESNTHTPACAEGAEGQISVEGRCLTGGGGNEYKSTRSSLNSTSNIKDEVSGYASAGGDEVVGAVEATNECNTIASSLVSTTDIESMLNKSLSEGESSLHVPSGTEAISHTSEPKITRTHEQDAPDLPSSNETISPLLEMKNVEVHKMQHVCEQDEEDRSSNQLGTQGPQWDVSDGEEDRSSLRFSFFHNGSLTPSEA